MLSVNKFGFQLDSMLMTISYEKKMQQGIDCYKIEFCVLTLFKRRREIRLRYFFTALILVRFNVSGFSFVGHKYS